MEVIVDLRFNKGFSWFSLENIYVKGYAFYRGYFVNAEDILQLCIKSNDLKKIIDELNGHFSIIVNNRDQLLLFVDHVRTFPVFYCQNNGKIIVSDDTTVFSASVNNSVFKMFECLGFCPFDLTLLTDVYQVEASNLLCFDESGLKKEILFSYLKERKVQGSNNEKISEVIIKAGKELIESAKNRKIVIPLSGGYDSRLIVCLTKWFNYNNVCCYTYGKKDDPEVKVSKFVANKLGVEWIFVDDSYCDFSNNVKEKDFFVEYFAFAFNNCSVPILQDFFAVKFMKENNLIPSNSIFVPGHAGDFLAGSHLNYFDRFKIFSVRNIVNKHCVINPCFSNGIFISKIKSLINSSSRFESYSVLENFNLKERQSKFIVNANKVYEFFGYEHRLPLLGIELCDFFKDLDYKYKFNSKLYDELVENVFFKKYNVSVERISSETKFLKLLKYLFNIMPISIVSFCRLFFINKRSIDFKRGYFNVFSDCTKSNLSHSTINGVIVSYILSKLKKK